MDIVALAKKACKSVLRAVGLLNSADVLQVPLSSALGTAASLNVGTSANNVVQLNGSAQLPALDGSLLTGVGGQTFSFGDATLDAAMRRLAGYYDFDDPDALKFANKSPFGRMSSIFPAGGALALSTDGQDGKGVRLDTAEYLAARATDLNPAAGGEFAINAWFRPDSALASSSAKALMGVNNPSTPTTGAAIDLQTDGGVDLYVDGSYRATSSSAPLFTDATNAMLTLVKRNVAGTPTWFYYFNGVEIASTATSANTNIILATEFVLVGHFGSTNGQPGVWSALSVWDGALSAAEITALYNSGTGRFLTVS